VNKLFNFGKSLWKDESGATAIEYGLLAALISVAIILTVSSLGETLDGVFNKVDTELAPSAAATGTGTGTGGTGTP
jgi:pilus assembly protein Flp/PilA